MMTLRSIDDVAEWAGDVNAEYLQHPPISYFGAGCRSNECIERACARKFLNWSFSSFDLE